MSKHRKNTMFPASRTTTKTSCFAVFAGAVKTLVFYGIRGVWGLESNAFYIVFGAPGDENNVKCECLSRAFVSSPGAPGRGQMGPERGGERPNPTVEAQYTG